MIISHYINDLLTQGKYCFSGVEAAQALGSGVKAGSSCAVDRVIYGAFTDTASSGCVSSTLVAKPDKPKDISCFSHGNSRFRHNALLCIDYKEDMLPVEVTPRLHSHFALAGLHRNGGRNRIGMLAGFTPEQCPVSRRNGGRNDSEYATGDVPDFTVRYVENLSQKKMRLN